MELDCGSCLLPFDPALRQPKVLPCGHTSCLACLLALHGEAEGADRLVTCTEDNQVFKNDPNELPNNMFILTHLKNNPPGRLNRSVTDEEPEVLGLEELIVLQQEKVDFLTSLRRELLEALKVHEDERRKQLQAVQACLVHLKGSDWKQHTTEAAELLDKCLPLLTEPELTTASLSLRTPGELSEKDNSWDSTELKLSDQPVLHMALLLLSEHDRLQHEHVDRGRKWPAPAGKKQERDFHQDSLLPVDIDVKKESNWKDRWCPGNKFTILSSYRVVNVLRNLECSVDKAWSLTLLKMHRSHLTHVELMNPKPEHILLLSLEEMPKLRRLKVVCEKRYNDDEDEPIPLFVRPDSTPLEQGLHWLDVEGLPLETLRSLLKTHAPTLKVLRLAVGTPPPPKRTSVRWPLACDNLHEIVMQAEMENLASVTLFRNGHHDKELCAEQLQALRDVVRPTCSVVCDCCLEEEKEEERKTQEVEEKVKQA